MKQNQLFIRAIRNTHDICAVTYSFCVTAKCLNCNAEHDVEFNDFSEEEQEVDCTCGAVIKVYSHSEFDYQDVNAKCETLIDDDKVEDSFLIPISTIGDFRVFYKGFKCHKSNQKDFVDFVWWRNGKMIRRVNFR